MASSMTASQEELKAGGVPLAWRDGCSAMLLILNGCRKRNMYVPWECDIERHTFEKCQFDDYMRRNKALEKKQKLAAAEEAVQ